MTTADLNVNGTHYRAELEPNGVIDIYENGKWVGAGVWAGNQIHDNTAELRGDADHENAIHYVLEGMLAGATQ